MFMIRSSFFLGPLVALLTSFTGLSSCGKPKEKPRLGPDARLAPAAARDAAAPSAGFPRGRPADGGMPAPPKGTPEAGTRAMFFEWTKETRGVYADAMKAVKRKAWADALPLLDRGLALTPENMTLRYWRVCVRSLAKDVDGAYADLEPLLFAHFPKYVRKAENDADLAPLREGAAKVRFEALLQRAGLAHGAAARHGLRFLGGDRAAGKVGDRLVGNQEIYAYLPASDRYLALTYHEDDQVLGFLESGRVTVVVVATGYDPKAPDPRLTGARVLVGHTPFSVASRTIWPGEPFRFAHRDEQRDRELEKSRGVGVAVSEIEVSLTEAGNAGPFIHASFEMPGVDPGRNEMRRDGASLTADQAFDRWDPHEGDPPSDGKNLARLRIRPCGATAATEPARPARDNEKLALGGKEVAVPCAGLVWKGPEAQHAAWKPYPLCRNRPEGWTGLYVLSAGVPPRPLTSDRNVTAVRWSSATQLLAQVGNRVLFGDAQQGVSRLLAAPVAFLQANAPYAAACVRSEDAPGNPRGSVPPPRP